MNAQQDNASRKKNTLLADLGLLYASAIWGSTFIMVKSSLAELNPVALVAYRFLLAALLIGLYLWWKKTPLFRNFKPGLVLGLVQILLYIPQTIGLKFTSAANSGFITGLFVAFTPPLLLLIPKQKPRPVQWLAVAVSLVGLWLVTGGVAEINAGDMITLSAALAYALHVILTDRYVQQDADHVLLVFQQFIVAGAASLLIALVFGQSMAVPSLKSGGVIVFLTLFPTISAYVVQVKAQTIATPIKVALIFALEPVFAGVFAWTFGGEEFSILKALGGLLIFAAVVLGTVERSSKKLAQTTLRPDKRRRPLKKRIFTWGVVLVFLVLLPRIITTLAAIPHTYPPDEVPEMEVVVVLAAETEHGRPSAVLRDRIQRGVDIYQAGKAEKIVMSGRAPEPEIMREYAVALGIPAEDILLDDGGVRTYATCYNAATQMELEEAIFVTQPFHMPRTLFLCRAMGVDAAGVPAHHGRYWRGSRVAWNIRETLATILAFSDLYLSPPDVIEYTTLYQEGVRNDQP